MWFRSGSVNHGDESAEQKYETNEVETLQSLSMRYSTVQVKRYDNKELEQEPIWE